MIKKLVNKQVFENEEVSRPIKVKKCYEIFRKITLG
jgi:hypothetical protein